MRNIVHFNTSRAQRNKEFGLDDLSDDTLNLASVCVAKVSTLPDGDWSNQELASLHLAVQLLQRAGVAVEMDRGITDDGNPWYIFCDNNGDVLVHFARIDSVYIIDGIGLDDPIRGKTLEDLINRFVSGAASDVTSEQQAGLATVFDLAKHRQNKVFVHPAAQLVALIWAAMIVKDAAAANAAESEWTTVQDEPYLPPVRVSEFDTTAFNYAQKQIVVGTSEHFSSGSFAKSRDALSIGIQSAGLLSLGYLLVGTQPITPSAVLDRIRTEKDTTEEGGAVYTQDYEAEHLFLDILDIIINLRSVTVDESAGSQNNDTVNADYVLGTNDHATATPLITAPELAFSANEPVDFIELGNLTSAQPSFLQMHEVPNAAGPSTPVNTLGSTQSTNEFTDYFFNYLDSFVVGSLDENEDLIADLMSFTENDETLSDLADENPSEVAIDDRAAIMMIIELLNSAEHEVMAYQDDDMHVIDYRGSGGSDTITVSWTFADGSQVLIVGTAADLHSLDTFF